MNPLKHKMANEWMRQDDASPQEALNTWDTMEAEFKANRVGTPTEEVTQFDRRIYETPEGERVSEKSTTFFLNGKWLNVPSIHNGRAFTDDQLRFMIKEGTIQPTSVHGSRIEAEEAAASRSNMMKSHVKGFAEGQLVRNTVDGSRPGFAGIKEVKNVKKFKKLPGVELGDYYFEVRNTEYAGPGKGGSPRITVGPFKNKKVAQKAFDERSKKASKIKQANLDLVTDVSNQQTKQINDFVTDFYDKNVTKYDIKDYQSFEKKLIEEFKKLGIKDSTRRRAIDTFGFPNVGKHSVKGKRGSSLPLNLYGMGARIPSGNVMQSDAQAFFKKTFYGAQLEKNPQLVKNLKRYLDYYNTDRSKGKYHALKANYADVLDPKVQSDLLYLLESDEIGTGKLRGGFLKQYLPEEYKTYIEKKNRFNLRYKQLMNMVENSLTKEQLNVALNGETSIKKFMTKQTDLLNKIFDTSELKKAGYSELIFNADHLEGMSEIAQMDNAEDKIRALRNLVGTTSKRNYELGIEGFSSKRKSLMGKIKNGTNVKDNMEELNKITKEVYPQFKGDLYKYHPATKTATPTKNFIVKYDPETAFRQYFNELVKDPIGSKILKKQYLDKPELQKVIEKDPKLNKLIKTAKTAKGPGKLKALGALLTLGGAGFVASLGFSPTELQAAEAQAGETGVIDTAKSWPVEHPWLTGGAGVAATATTKAGRKGLGKIVGGAFGPTGIALSYPAFGMLGEDFKTDLSKPLDRAVVEGEAALAPTLVKGTEAVTKGIKNPLIRKGVERALNLGMSLPMAMRVARIASPLGLLSLGGEGLYHMYKKGHFDKERMMPSLMDKEAYKEAQQEQFDKDQPMFAGGGIASLMKK